MLTRLKVSGFKNLVDVDVRFGPFTCIAGPNGVGKSNLFDAILFLSALADGTLSDAALSARATGETAADIRGLFNRTGRRLEKRMRFEAEMIVPPSAVDDLGKKGRTKITTLRYELELNFREPNFQTPPFQTAGLEIVREELTYIPKKKASRLLLFHHTKQWRDAAVIGASRSPFISTIEDKDGRAFIKLHQDGSRGRSSLHAAESLPRTLLSSGSASESPTALCARREMTSWRMLRLEPSALRKPCDFNSPRQISADGKFLAGALHHMARIIPGTGAAPDEAAVYCQISNRLSELIGGVDSLRVDRDEKRALFTIFLKEINGAEFPARALSDGALRFLALAVVEMDNRDGGVICIEEPENGIHPARISAMIRLLQDMAADEEEKIEKGDPLRQVIINTHSPAVVAEAPDDSLLIAESVETYADGERGANVRFSCLPETWRANAPEKPHVVAKGDLLAYLNPRFASSPLDPETRPIQAGKGRRACKVRDREDLQRLLPSEVM